ncbi:hypothetical protein ACQ4M3_05760 [Leptolyngbya sp. AN03gr2]|uniref:hypothetical protein n=1 Tax=unclassified Leptolyngbya TaxID=2650499 RepID=UPI003D31590B
MGSTSNDLVADSIRLSKCDRSDQLTESTVQAGNREMVSQLQNLPIVETFGTLEPVAYFNGAMLTGVTVSHGGRIFVNFPRWGDEVPFTVAEIRDGRPVPFEFVSMLNPFSYVNQERSPDWISDCSFLGRCFLGERYPSLRQRDFGSSLSNAVCFSACGRRILAIIINVVWG